MSKKRIKPNCHLEGVLSDKKGGNSRAGDAYVNYTLYDGYYYHKCVAWVDIADTINQLPDGSEIKIEGQIRYKTYTDKSGVKRTVTNIYTLSVEAMSEPEVQDDVEY